MECPLSDYPRSSTSFSAILTEGSYTGMGERSFIMSLWLVSCQSSFMEWERNPNPLLFHADTWSFWPNSGLDLIPIGTDFSAVWVVTGDSALGVRVGCMRKPCSWDPHWDVPAFLEKSYRMSWFNSFNGRKRRLIPTSSVKGKCKHVWVVSHWLKSVKNKRHLVQE